MLKSESAVARLNASQELITRPADESSKAAFAIASDASVALYTRVAALFTYGQIARESGIANLVQLTEDNALREFALRALTDRKEGIAQVPIAPFLNGLKDPSPRVKAAAIIGLGRLGRLEATSELLKTQVPASFAAPAKKYRRTTCHAKFGHNTAPPGCEGTCKHECG
ncbi:HEAT repeat domain-containing protein [Mucilaginibacter sp. UC70_90]